MNYKRCLGTAKNVHGDGGLAADANGFLQSRHDLFGLVANVGQIDSAVSRGDPGQFDQFLD